MNRGATFSDCGQYRYRLWRIWEQQKPRLVFIMLNPSIADAENNDPTVERCQRRAQTGGYGGVEVLNVFAYRATDPIAMKAAGDPIGPQNDHELRLLAGAARSEHPLIVAAWGHHAAFRDRDKQVLKIFEDARVPLFCLGITKYAYPRHPLYVGYETKPMLFQEIKSP